ncbi:UNVERIFIED_CONTAM: hypothetical protein K2H54_051404 [Gekko kuhli]
MAVEQPPRSLDQRQEGIYPPPHSALSRICCCLSRCRGGETVGATAAGGSPRERSGAQPLPFGAQSRSLKVICSMARGSRTTQGKTATKGTNRSNPWPGQKSAGAEPEAGSS